MARCIKVFKNMVWGRGGEGEKGERGSETSIVPTPVGVFPLRGRENNALLLFWKYEISELPRVCPKLIRALCGTCGTSRDSRKSFSLPRRPPPRPLSSHSLNMFTQVYKTNNQQDICTLSLSLPECVTQFQARNNYGLADKSPFLCSEQAYLH